MWLIDKKGTVSGCLSERYAPGEAWQALKEASARRLGQRDKRRVLNSWLTDNGKGVVMNWSANILYSIWSGMRPAGDEKGCAARWGFDRLQIQSIQNKRRLDKLTNKDKIRVLGGGWRSQNWEVDEATPTLRYKTISNPSARKSRPWLYATAAHIWASFCRWTAWIENLSWQSFLKKSKTRWSPLFLWAA